MCERCDDLERRVITQMLNALHVCHPNHPLNSKFQWRNAYAMVAQRPSYEIGNAMTAWLAKQAQTGAAA